MFLMFILMVGLLVSFGRGVCYSVTISSDLSCTPPNADIFPCDGKMNITENRTSKIV